MVLTWSTGKPPIREHPISPGTMRAYLRDSSGDQLHRRVISDSDASAGGGNNHALAFLVGGDEVDGCRLLVGGVHPPS